jgi:serine/threonine-protein kinase
MELALAAGHGGIGSTIAHPGGEGGEGSPWYDSGVVMRGEEGRSVDASASGGPDPLIGQVINGKFRIHRAIARGGMGRIYYATQVPFERPVALKVVQADTVNEEESQFLKRFLQEASILAKLQHPNVVMLFDYGRIEQSSVERYFIAMEYLDGETLASRFKARGALSTAELLVLVRQIMRGLREAHSRGIVHRDLKPSNILLVKESDGGDLVKLVDFGIGKVIQRNAVAEDLTQEGVMVGTPRYMAPEQFDGTVSPASDIYALGTIMYQALTGTLPFRGTTLAEFMVAKFAHAIPRIREVNPHSDAPDSLEAVIMGMLARGAHERPGLDALAMQLGAVEEEVFGTPHSMRRNLTGSGPQLSLSPSMRVPRGPTPASGVVNAQNSLVPPTMVLPSERSGVGNAVALAAMGLTPRPMSTSARPEPPARPKTPVLGVAISLGVLVALAAGAGWYATSHATTRAADAHADATTAQAAQAGSAAQAGAKPAATAASFTFEIDSTPRGATVSEGDHVLGETPLEVTIERASVASGPRTFTVKKDGYIHATVTQGPSDADTKTMVALAAQPSKHPRSSTHSSGGSAPAQTSKPQGNGGLDIRLNR